MPLQFDAVIWDIVKEILPYIAVMLLADVILIYVLRRFWTPRQKLTSPADETQTTTHISFDSGRIITPDQLIETNTHRDGISTSSTDIRHA